MFGKRCTRLNDKNKDKRNNTNKITDPQNNSKDKKNKNKKKSKAKRLVEVLLCVVFIVCIVFVAKDALVEDLTANELKKTYNEFTELVDENKVKEIQYDINGDIFFFTVIDDEKTYHTDNPRLDEFKSEMLKKDIAVIEVDLEENDFGDTVRSILFLIVQYGLIIIMFSILFKKMQGGTDEIDLATSSTNTFDDVAGLEEVKESLLTTVDMLKYPKKYEAAGARISKGVLLYGPPGTGKTLLAKAIAGEAGVNFLATNGADFDNKYVGVGADKVRKLFQKAKKQAPCILFIDELDAIGCKRSGTDKAYERQTLNQLLSCMDGFTTSDGVFIFAATNDVNALDPALLRPGRFDSRFAVGLPDTTRDRVAIINLYMKNKKKDETVSIESLAKQTLGCSPAAIEAIINDAAIESVKNGGIINQKNIDDAFYRQIMDGHKKKNIERNEKEIRTVAWHEAGHALIGYLQNEEVSKISIVPTTTGTGGVTLFNQKKMGMYSKIDLENHIRTLYAGRNAEILLNGEDEVTTGASNDLQEATKCIKQMVSCYGMSDYGLLNLNELEISAEEVVEEYKKISKKLDKQCYEMLKNNLSNLKILAGVLVVKETMDEKEIVELFKRMGISEENYECEESQ